MNKFRYVIRLIYYAVPLGVVMSIGGLVGFAADVTDWRWLERLDLWLRGQAEEMIARFSRP